MHTGRFIASVTTRRNSICSSLLQSIVERRNALHDITYSVAIRVVHWDVNNEQEHGPWFEDNTADPGIMTDMFIQTRAHDPDGLLFLNEYGVVTYSQSAQVLMT